MTSILWAACIGGLVLAVIGGLYLVGFALFTGHNPIPEEPTDEGGE